MTDGLDPTLGAILPLVGVVLGVLATAGVTYSLKRRDERHELRAAARVLVADLAATADYLLHIIDTRKWTWLPEDAAASVSAKGWNQYRDLMARRLTDDREWRAVADAFELGRVAGYLVAGCTEHAEKERYGRELVGKLRAGADVLGPLAFPDR